MVSLGCMVQASSFPGCRGRHCRWAVAIVGAGIMPANFYLHSALVHSRCSQRCTTPCDLCGSYILSPDIC